MIVVFYGQPTSGKTTLCKSFFSWMKNTLPLRVHYMDGDKFRSIFNNKSYDRQGRIENLKLASQIAHYEMHLNDVVLMAFMFPYKEMRDYLRSFGHKVMWVYLHYDKEESRGREHFWDDTFELPMDEYNTLNINTSQFTEQEALALIKANYTKYIKK